MKLEDSDKRALALLGTQPRPIAELAAHLGVSPEMLDDRFAELAAKGLVYDLGDSRYRRTESGRRVLMTSRPEFADERIDTSPEIERTIGDFGLPPEAADAVRRAFAFLRYWGWAVEEEIIDAIYSEAPAGYESSEAWWDELVREPLAALPDIEVGTDADDPWRYTGTPEAGEPLADGRRVLSKTHPVYGDVKHTLESLDLTESEREAVRAAFRFLYRRGELSEREVLETIYPEYPAGYPSPQRWWDGIVRRAFDSFPNVERIGEHTWRYRAYRAKPSTEPG